MKFKNIFNLSFPVALFLFCSKALCITSPEVSANALFLYRNSNFHKENLDPTNIDPTPNGANVQETELQFYADVDPYSRLNLLFSIAPTYQANGTQVEEIWKIEPEEAFFDNNLIPSIAVKVGKFKAAMGKHNTLHTHAFPFVEAPLANKHLLGEEGLNDAGISAAALLPSSWFNELTLQVLRGKGENAEFNSPSPGQQVGLVHWKNLVNLSEALTAEVGLSYAQGDNSYKKTTQLTGFDLTFKWRPLEGGRYQSFLWTAEYLQRIQGRPGFSDEKGHGVATWIQYQFAERWACLYRFDTLIMNNSFDTTNLPNETWERHSLGFILSASEFSSFKLEFDHRNGGPKSANNESIENSIFLQANLTIGAHPSHAY
ncbi:MAG: hypothetical protein ACXVCY_02510 [Pseudobdellovibrionaceae bacterium]